MKIPLKTLLFILSISLMFLACPFHSSAEEETSIQTKDIQILIGEDVENKVINVSTEGIRKRILKGEPVHFVEAQTEEKRTIKSNWIIDALKKKDEEKVEKIDIKNAIIIDDLDFHMNEHLLDIDEIRIEGNEINKLEFIGVKKICFVYPSIKIAYCQLQGNLKAGHDQNLKSIVMFEKSVSFNNSEFIEKADFGSASFREKANFWSSIFNGEASFGYASFNDASYFINARFEEKADFGSASFNGEAYFEASFKEKASFGFAHFNGKVNFTKAGFYGEADFNNTSFNDASYFEHANFNGETSFNKAHFKEVAFLNGTTFSSKVVDLRLTRYPELQISWSQFKEGQLDNLWLAEQEKDIVSWQGVYLKLIKNFENIGDTKSADDAYYHYRCKKYMFCKGWWEKTKWSLGFFFLGLACGYGVIPWHTIVTASILILSFTFAYYFKKDSLEYKKEDQTKARGNLVKQSFGHCLYFSVVTFTTLGYGDFRPLGIFRYVAMTEGIFGWLTMSLFLVTLANVWLR